MAYIFRNTEKNNEKASTFETKSLLYLLGMRKDSHQIETVAIDCFNDVSGLSQKYDKVWDIQSKNHQNFPPKKIGKALFTLFNNFLSTLDFYVYILFVNPLEDRYKIDAAATSYGFENIVPSTLSRIKKGLSDEVLRVKACSYEKEVTAFLKEVIIVEDCNTEAEYIQKIIKFKNKSLLPEQFYVSVFTDLRNKQASLKIPCIENIEITEIKEVLELKKHLARKHIETLLINRIIGAEVFSYKAVPLRFLPVIAGLDHEEILDIVQECNSNLSIAFFNRNSNKQFWRICEEMITHVSIHPDDDVSVCYTAISKTLLIKNSYLSPLTVKYLLSIIFEGLST